ncbi:patatin-like protein 6 [Impatiens glandulifera]|uniref:patatin-like protein 6 n=1 Tax=Impatiens glandulifera TaxID=253017 RepID=UPI001FB08D82|nr:patatin-like protein 6 [Impatiens glandulifera]
MMMNTRNQSESAQEPNDNKLSYEIFSILESKFLFGYEEHKLRIPKQISTPTTETRSGPSSDDSINAIKNQRGKICILCIDGGGMRNIVSGKALAYLEDALRRKSGKSNARIAEFFDVAAGAGIGGIFTAMLFGTKDQSRPISEATDTWKFLATQGKNFYQLSSSSSSGSGSSILRRFLGRSSIDRSSKSMSSELEKLMRELFSDADGGGRSLTLKDTLKPVLIPCYDLSSSAPFLFSRADALETDGFDFKLWEVCRATSAQPVLFQPVSMKSVNGKTHCLAVDGGLAMNNPTSAAITHVLHNKQEFPFVRGVEDLLVLSLGTGQLLEASYDSDQIKRWKAKHWARPMTRISGDYSSEMVDHAVSMAFGQNRCNYVRIQANGSRLGGCGPNVDYDGSPSNVKKLSDIADEMLKQKNMESVLFGGKRISEHSNSEKLDWFADQLILEHQRRSCRIAPTVAFRQPDL